MVCRRANTVVAGHWRLSPTRTATMVIARGQGDHIRRDAEPRGREQVALNDLAKRGIGAGGAKCRSYAVEASVRGIFARTREITADRGAEAGLRRVPRSPPMNKQQPRTPGPFPIAETLGRYLPDFVLGANDGVITTFAVISGVVGASLSSKVVVIMGFANLIADGFSMAASNILSRRSEAHSARPLSRKSGLTASPPSSDLLQRVWSRSSPIFCRGLTAHNLRRLRCLRF